MSEMHLRIGVPCFGGLLQAQCAWSIMQLRDKLTSMGIRHSLDMELHESLVQRARNNLTHRMLCSNATHLLFVDADIQFNPDDALGLLSTRKDFVCGAYPKKSIDLNLLIESAKRGDKDPLASASKFTINVIPPTDGSLEVKSDDTGCMAILDAPTGFMLLSREVLIAMAAEHPETAYRSDHPDNRGELIHALFDCAIVNQRYLSEDYLFSRRWQRMGGTCWLYLPAKLSHIGTYVYRGDLTTIFQPIQAA